MSRNFVLNKFCGTLMGSLLGDCLGAPFEMSIQVSHAQLNIFIQQLLDTKLKVPYKPYTDDTVMTKAVAHHIIQHKGINPTELARRFTTDYFAQPKRGYGSGVVDLFMNFRRNGFDEPFEQARNQFGGEGSFGNGAAMRVAPLALYNYYESDIDQLVSMTSDVSRITHGHALGIQGACLQSLALREALLSNPSEEFNRQTYLDRLITYMENWKNPEERYITLPSDDSPSYVSRLKIIKEFLQRNTPVPVEEVQNSLGSGVAAINTVPTAIYSFLIALNPIQDLECENELLRSIIYAISLGGDTDTVGSMAGALSGALLGYDQIPQALNRHCEKPDEILQLANSLFEIVENSRAKKQVVV